MLQDTVDTLRAIGAGLFLVEFLAYAVLGYLKFDARYRALSEVLHDNMLVAGLNMFLYAYLADGGALQWSWLVYAISCVYLAVTFYRVLTYDRAAETKRALAASKPKNGAKPDLHGDIEAERSYEYMLMKLSVFLMLLSGLVINLLASSTWRWAVYIAAFVPFLFAVLYHFRAVNMRTGGETPSKYWIRIVTYATMVFWLGYPVMMLLGPLFLGTISLAGVALGYILLDLVTKHLLMALAAYYMYMEAPEDDEACNPRRGNSRYSSV